ncbi:MAG: hypothetical protein HKN05_19460 [Rhizobiales bacterium]|nr:hypothetical protein [Hyphomicrobiales bacterium]
MNSRLPWSDRQSDYERAGAYDHPEASPGRGSAVESSALHQKLNELSSQLSAMVSEDATHRRRMPQSEPRRYSESNPEQSMHSLLDRIENNEISSTHSMSDLNRQLANLAEKLDREEPSIEPERSPHRDVAPTFDSAIKNVMAHVEQSEARTRSTMKALQDRIAEIGARAASSSNKGVQDTAAPIEDLERRLAGIAAKLDKQEKASRKDSRIESLEKKISELAESLPEAGAFQAMAPAAPGTVDAGSFFAADGAQSSSGDHMSGAIQAAMDAMEKRLEDLAAEVRGTVGNNLSQEDVSRLWTDQSALAEQVRQLKASAASNRDLQSMRSSFEQLTKQVKVHEDPSRFDQINQRINELAQRLESNLPNTAEFARTNELEAKILQLDARLSAAQAHPENSVAVKALEAQVKQIADRLGEHERRIETISELEASITQLTSRLQTTRNEVAASAEQAAARMADQLRVEVEHKVSEKAVPDASAELQALQQGLNAIQNNSQSSDRRTHETLIAVHDTLDSVIERMNQIEAAKAAIAADTGMPVAPLSPAAKVDPLTPSAAEAATAPAFEAPQPAPNSVAAHIETITTAPAPEPTPELAPEADVFVEREPPEAVTLAAPVPTPEAAPAFEPATPREDFIAAAREAARAAGHSINKTGPMAASLRPDMAGAPHLGGQNVKAQPMSEEGGGKRRQLLVAGVMALIIGAVAAYGLLNGYSGPGSTKSKPQVTQSAPRFNGGAASQNGTRPAPAAIQPGQGTDTGGSGVQPAESVPFDPTAPQKNGSLGDAVPTPADPTQTASISNSSSKSDAPKPDIGSGSLNSNVPMSPTSTLKSNPVLDPNVTSIGSTSAETAPGGLLPPTLGVQASPPAAADPFVTGSISNAEPGEADDRTSLSAEQAKTLATLPKALGPEAMLWSAVKGDKVAQFMVATRYSDGKAVSKNFDQAAIWYHKAASKGLAPAQYRLGTLYERGRGVKKDVNSAKAWYEHAAHRGHIKAMHNLAVLHANSPGGRAKFNQAGYWFKKAASLGLKDSQYNLAILYEEGLGVQQDLLEAYRWYTLAAKQKDKDAAKRLEKVKTKMIPADLAKAKQMVETWRPVRAKFSANVVTPPIGGWQKPEMVKVRGTTQEHVGLLPAAATKEAQRLLNAIGYDAGTPDGQMGPRTANAIKQFQTQHGSEPTGKVTPALLEKLRNLPG